MGLMKVSELRWRVGRVVHIYNSAGSLDRLDHYGRQTTPAFGLPPIQKTYASLSHRALFCCEHLRHTLVNLIAPPLEIYIRMYKFIAIFTIDPLQR